MLSKLGVILVLVEEITRFRDKILLKNYILTTEIFLTAGMLLSDSQIISGEEICFFTKNVTNYDSPPTVC